VAENLTDAFVAPACFYLVFGLAGAAVYRAVNTADAMFGYREGPLEHFGKVAARLDDALNFLPARLAGWAVVVAGALAGGRGSGALAGMPGPETCPWEIPRQAEHGDYATNVAMTLARAARRSPRQVAELIATHFPSLREVERVAVAGPGFLNVFLSPAWCTAALGEILEAGDTYGRGASERGRRVRLEFVSANPTGPLVIVSARAAAVGDSLARLLRAQEAQVTTEFYINDAGSQFEALARSLEARVRQGLGMPAELPANGYPGEYLVDLASEYVEEQRARGADALEALEALVTDAGERERLERFGRYAVSRIVEQQRRSLRDYGVEFDVWTSEQRDVRDLHLPEKV